MSTPPPPTSGETIGGDDDLLTEILTHLPVKPLLRFKSINKQLNSLISHPHFSLLHTLRHPHPPPTALFFRHHLNNHPSFSLLSLSSAPPPPFSPPAPNLLQSSHGLLLFSSDHHIHVSNPTTRRTATVSLPDRCAGISLAFDPLKWGQSYFILMVQKLAVNGEVSNSYAIAVYCSSTRQWASKVECFEFPFDTEFDRGVYWGGRVFWLSHMGSMVYYDFEGECVGRLVLPRMYDEGAYMERFRYFGESCGQLHLVEIRTNCVREFDVLELKESAGGVLEWWVKYKVDLDVVGCGFEEDIFQDHVDRFGRGLRFYALSILAVIVRNPESEKGGDNGDGEGDALVLSLPGKVISYDFKRKVSRLLCNVVDDCDKWLPFRGYNAFPFIESLCCV